MNESASVPGKLLVVLDQVVSQAVAYLPKVVAAIAVLLVGWLLARLVRWSLVRLVAQVDELWERLISKRGMDYLHPRHPPARIIGELAFWLLMLAFITLATDILGLGLFSTWLSNLVGYLPLAVAGLLIVLVGFVLSSLARDLVTSAAASTGVPNADLLGRASQIIILFIAVIIGIDQIGINITFIAVVAGIVLAAMLGAVALAFGLGARTHVSNIIAANQLRYMYQIGDKVRIGEYEGRISDISAARMVIETTTGTVDVPAKLFDEQVTVITEKGSPEPGAG